MSLVTMGTIAVGRVLTGPGQPISDAIGGGVMMSIFAPLLARGAAMTVRG